MSFEIDGYEFELTPLKVEEQLRAMTLLAPILLGIRKGGDVAALLPALDGLQELRKTFTARCKFKHPDIAGGTIQALGTFENVVFARASLRLLTFLGRCIELEFGDFLGANGLKLSLPTPEKSA